MKSATRKRKTNINNSTRCNIPTLQWYIFQMSLATNANFLSFPYAGCDIIRKKETDQWKKIKLIQFYLQPYSEKIFPKKAKIEITICKISTLNFEGIHFQMPQAINTNFPPFPFPLPPIYVAVTQHRNKSNLAHKSQITPRKLPTKPK